LRDPSGYRVDFLGLGNHFNGCGRLAKKDYTVLIVSQQTAKIKKFIVSPFYLKIAAAFSGILLLFSAFMIYDYVIYRLKVVDLHRLQEQTYSQRVEIRNVVGKITLLEGQLNTLKEIRAQMERDLKEVNELKRIKTSPPLVNRKRTSNSKKEDMKEGTFLREEEVSILEKERSRLVSHLHQDLLMLRKEALQRKQNLKELQEVIQGQKSVLLAIPSLWPVLGQISSRFGDTRFSGSSGGTRPHKGLDISSAMGNPIVAPADGGVTSVGVDLDYGRLIFIDHGHGFASKYGHLENVYVQTGEKVKKGQAIGAVGSTGHSTGPHLHYEVRIQGNPVNPIPYLTQR